MDFPTPSNAVVAFAAFVRDRLADVGGSLTPSWPRGDGSDLAVRPDAQQVSASGARHLAMVIIGAAAPFAPTAHARARLLRQAHASGLLSARDAETAIAFERAAIGHTPRV
ncbi:MAG: hypothetical protein M3O28_08920 [Actinomycetota bacterium]|nr:hypothetical protein [Actinomycetota bacterium]